MSLGRRVVVTGMGAITPIGNSVEEFWQGIRGQRVGIDVLDRFDTSAYKVKLAAQVKNFHPEDFMDVKAAKRMELFCQYAVAAAKEALLDSGIVMEKEYAFRVGVSVVYGIVSLIFLER